MTNRIEPGTASIVMSDVDLVAELMVEMNAENERANRNAMRDEREIAAAAGELRLGQMKEAADFRLASGLVSGASKIGSSIAGGIAAANRAPTTEPTVEGTSAPAHDNTVSDRATAAASSLDGAGTATSALLGHFASSADIRAEAAKMTMDRAASRADERRSDAEEAARSIDSLHDALHNALSEKRRAEEASTRA